MKSHIPRSLPVFRELQNSRNFVSLRQAAILYPKNPLESGAFQRGLERIVYNPGITIFFCRAVLKKLFIKKRCVFASQREIFFCSLHLLTILALKRYKKHLTVTLYSSNVTNNILIFTACILYDNYF